MRWQSRFFCHANKPKSRRQPPSRREKKRSGNKSRKNQRISCIRVASCDKRKLRNLSKKKWCDRFIRKSATQPWTPSPLFSLFRFPPPSSLRMHARADQHVALFALCGVLVSVVMAVLRAVRFSWTQDVTFGSHVSVPLGGAVFYLGVTGFLRLFHVKNSSRKFTVCVS